jgi:ribosome recycling factor
MVKKDPELYSNIEERYQHDTEEMQNDAKNRLADIESNFNEDEYQLSASNLKESVERSINQIDKMLRKY